MGSNPNSPEFRALQAAWDAKLADSGFSDIEDRQGRLKKWSRDVFCQRPEWQQSKAEYFRAAGKFLYDYKFPTPKVRMMWELHAEGESVRDITRIMKSRRFRVNRDMVQKTLQALAKIMVEENGRSNNAE